MQDLIIRCLLREQSRYAVYSVNAMPSIQWGDYVEAYYKYPCASQLGLFVCSVNGMCCYDVCVCVCVYLNP